MEKRFSGSGEIVIGNFGISVNRRDIAEQIAKDIGYEKKGSQYCAPLYGKITVIIDTVGVAPFEEEASCSAAAYGGTKLL